MDDKPIYFSFQTKKGEAHCGISKIADSHVYDISITDKLFYSGEIILLTPEHAKRIEDWQGHPSYDIEVSLKHNDDVSTNIYYQKGQLMSAESTYCFSFNVNPKIGFAFWISLMNGILQSNINSSAKKLIQRVEKITTLDDYLKKKAERFNLNDMYFRNTCLENEKLRRYGQEDLDKKYKN